MIKSINVKNCASYNEVGISLSNCNKVNFIYGHNGSGKSTISNFLMGINSHIYSDCSLEWETGTETDILVYNKNFRQRNLNSMPGVFTLGESTAEQLKHLDELNNELENRRKELACVEKNIEKENIKKEALITKFEDNSWTEIYKKNETDFSEAFAGLRGNKKAFNSKVIEYYNKTKNPIFTKQELIEKSKILFQKKPTTLSTIPVPNIDVLDIIESGDIWQKIIIGNKDIDIAPLINALDNADWVKNGMKYIKNSSICPFCQKETINDQLIEKLNGFFSGEYERQLQLVGEYIDKYNALSENLKKQIRAWIDLAKSNDFDYNFTNIENSYDNFNLIIEGNKQLFNIKYKEPSRQIIVESSHGILLTIKKTMDEINYKIESHNKLIQDYKKQKEKLIDDVWTLLISENSALIKTFVDTSKNSEKSIKGLNEKRDSLLKTIHSLNEKIFEESKNITSVQPTVDAINRSLRAYGFDGFSIVSSKDEPNKYQIMRSNGTIATDTLSEGEETFISFLYFVYMTRGGLDTGKIGNHKIIVIDDPICSLDSSILYVVSSLVRELADNAKNGTNNIDQLFVFTHNVYFHKEISFKDGRDKVDKNVKFWILKKKNEITSIKCYEQKNPVTTSYALLWKEIKEANSISNVYLQNAMRRVLENFFGTLGNANIDEILKCFDSPEEKSICKSLFSWVNDGSHSIPDDLEFCDDNDASEKFKKVFKDIFYNTSNQYHYDMMMR